MIGRFRQYDFPRAVGSKGLRSEWLGQPNRSIFVATWLTALTFLLLVGCTQDRVVRSSWDNLTAMGDPPPSVDGDGERRQRGQAWAIRLQQFRGDRPLREAYEYAQKIQRETQLADVWFLDHGDVAAVYVGRYSRKDHPDAKAALRTVKAARLEGDRPFRGAELVVIDRRRGDGAGLDEHDLRQFSGYMTLLVAVYDREFGRDYREAAEDYADQLRAESEHKIYYYHGPNQSIVTTGLFTRGDFVAVEGVDAYGPTIRERQEVFPHVLKNGKTMRNSEVQTDDQLEPSIIVRVP